ncbi:MAG: SIMPL domain-containing protein [Patescibacteria group bacterium]
MEIALLPWKKVFNYGLIAVVLIFLYSWIMSPLVITVTGVGEASVPAENALLTFSLVSNTDNPNDAVTLVKENVKKIKESLKNFGVGDSDVYESQVTVVPAGAVVAGSTGFQASTSIGLKINSVSNLDSLTAALYGLGASVVSQPQLSVKNSKKVESEAYELALKDAKSKANSVALKNWKLIKKIVLIQESQTPATTTVTKQASEIDSAELDVDPNTGLIKFSKVLSVSYKLW